MAHRALSQSEIERLQSQGCSAEDWSRVQVADPFLAERVAGVQFSGEVRLGDLRGGRSLAGGVTQACGVYRARLHDCAVGDRCLVSGVGVLAGYRLADDVVVENVGELCVTGETGFGNGVEIDVMNEAGGRTLPLCDRLSAQLAYLIVCYRHRPELVASLVEMVRAYAGSCRSAVGSIGEGAEIRNAGVVRNVKVGAWARVDGAARLEEGTIASCREAPVFVGSGVVASRFILLSGSRVDQGAIVDRCLVGQAVRLGKQFSAENSAFFCNSELFHGEACSVFGGPYTVSHHKSTLLIAGLFSFYNAGSGTNQSNHMYKLGPVHQGVLERGCKTGSGSYLLWPSRVGPFSNILGKHYAHFDTSDLPFSVVNEYAGRSACIPGMNMFTVGTRRDGAKWPARDGRTDPVKLDQLHFAVLSPYVIGKMLRGLERLHELARSAREGQEFLNFNGIAVQKTLVRTSARYYEIAIKLFIGQCLIRKLEELAGAGTLEELQAALAEDVAEELGQWLDIGGMLVTERSLSRLLAQAVADDAPGLDWFERRCHELHGEYDRQEWAWCARLIEVRAGQPLRTMPAAGLIRLLEEWRDTVTKFNNMIVQDAAKEFDADVKLGYGIDGDLAVREADFAAVRGTHQSNAFVRSVREDSERASARAERAIELLSRLAEPRS